MDLEGGVVEGVWVRRWVWTVVWEFQILGFSEAACVENVVCVGGVIDEARV